jgi:uncharacterized protein (DUF983 family)
MTQAVPKERMLARGLAKRCARCGAGHLFTKWVTMKDDCPGCGLHFEREQGYWAGALAINFIAVGGLFLVTLGTILVLTIPNIQVVPVLCVVVPIMTIGPVFFYPFSKTIWVAVDRGYLQRLDTGEANDEHYGS